MLIAITNRLNTRAAALQLSLENRLERIMFGWLLIAGLASAARVSFSGTQAPMDVAGVAPYFLLVLAPFASMVLALRWFANGEDQPQPVFRLAQLGKWRTVSAFEGRSHPLYGTGGLMVSLLIGMLLNVPVRAAEYLVAMPAIAGPVPAWLAVLHTMMTLDVVLLPSLYAIAFVAALRRVPLFPRLLVAIWVIDLAMQLVTAQLVAGAGGLPSDVATSLQSLLVGNAKKVLISAGLWFPYLLLSQRVNVTFRSRVEA